MVFHHIHKNTFQSWLLLGICLGNHFIWIDSRMKSFFRWCPIARFCHIPLAIIQALPSRQIFDCAFLRKHCKSGINKSVGEFWLIYFTFDKKTLIFNISNTNADMNIKENYLVFFRVVCVQKTRIIIDLKYKKICSPL